MRKPCIRHHPKIRKKLLFDAAYDIASTHPLGLSDLRLAAIAHHVGCVPSLFYHYYTSVSDIKIRIIRKARRNNDRRILNQLEWQQDI